MFKNNFEILRYDDSTLSVNNAISDELSIFTNLSTDYIEINYSVETGLSPVSTDEINIYNILDECILSSDDYRGTHPFIPSQQGKILIGVWLKPNSERINGPRPEGQGY